MTRKSPATFASVAFVLLFSGQAVFGDGNAPTPAATTAVPATTETAPEQLWNFHIQNTDLVQGDPAFSAKYSGPNSLNSHGEVRETVSLDFYGGLRLWKGAEAHIDALVFQGVGLSSTLGVEDFTNNEAFKVAANHPEFSFARLFVRQTFGLGGEQEDVPDDQLTLAGKQDVSRLTITAGRFSAADVFDTNIYAGDGRSQFMNWAMVTNIAWDYPADSIGFTTGISLELNQPDWALRYGFFELPSIANSWTADDRLFTFPEMRSQSDGEFFKSWAMPLEYERRYTIANHPGSIKLLAWLNEANMGSYVAALSVPGTIIAHTRSYRLKYGFGLNWAQEISSSVGVFSRLGWNDGHEEAWAYSDVNYSASGGVSVKGQAWQRPDDTFGIAAVFSGISRENQKFLKAGGTGILDGDGALNYGWEKVVETYYNIKLFSNFQLTLDYQFVVDPAFNRERGPVSVFGARLHWAF